MIRKINLAKPNLLKKLNKVCNGEKAKIGDYIHKNCRVKSEYWFQNNFVPNTSSDSIDAHVELPELQLPELQLPDLHLETETIIFNESFTTIDTNVTNDLFKLNAADETSTTTVSQDTLKINMQKSYSSHKKCFVCRSDKNKLKLITNEAALNFLAKTDIYVVNGSRCCHSHLDEKGFLNNDAIKLIKPIVGDVVFDENSIKDLIKSFQNSKSKNQFYTQFESSSPLEDDSLKLIGFSKDEFLYIVDYLNNTKESIKRTKQQALFIYLFWLRHGLSMETIATLFDISFQDVSRYCFQIRSGLKSFVEDNLGVKRYSRDDWLAHNTEMVSKLFIEKENQLILIADGTYCYCEKSSNNSFQRMTYSGQKKRHLVKPFVVCVADGTIVDIYGFYAATANDATIMEDVLSRDNFLRELLQPEDILIADRGFRDCQKTMKEKYNINVILPTCKVL
jgi:hypothetical protein